MRSSAAYRAAVFQAALDSEDGSLPFRPGAAFAAELSARFGVAEADALADFNAEVRSVCAERGA